MRPPSTDWHAVAEAKLASVLGAAKGSAALREALEREALSSVASAHDLYRVAQRLIASGGFAGAVGGLLSVHALMYGGEDVMAPGAATPSDRATPTPG